jgi:hypothetical protein
MFKNSILVYDNGGESFDRYTIVTPDNSVYGASDNPFHPQGFGQFVGDVPELVDKHSHLFYDHKTGSYDPAYVQVARRDFTKRMGKQDKRLKDLSVLPQPVKRYIKLLTNIEI